MGHPHLLVVRVCVNQPIRYLTRRPPQLKLLLNHRPELMVHSQLGRFGTPGPMPRRPMSSRSPILRPAAVRSHLPRDRRRSPPQPGCDTPHRLTSRQPPRNLLPFGQRQPKGRPLRTRHRSTEPRTQQMSPDRRRRSPQPPADRPLRLTSLEPIPNLNLLQLGQPSHHTPPRRETTTLVEGDATTPRIHTGYALPRCGESLPGREQIAG